MNDDRVEHIDRLFYAALEMAPDRRTTFLTEACAADADLLNEVQSLLSAHDRAAGFIEASAADVAAEFISAGREAPGEFIGEYRILSLLGAGGMGEVYLAEDSRLGRRVALKLLPASFAENDDRVERFRREARTASALNHPNILTVYETGRWRGRDFIATEFVDGERTAAVRGTLRVAVQPRLDVSRPRRFGEDAAVARARLRRARTADGVSPRRAEVAQPARRTTFWELLRRVGFTS